MKKLILVSLLTAALTPCSSFAQSDARADADNDAIVQTVPPRRVAVGMTRRELAAAAGAPDAMLDANVWAYWNFRVRNVPADQNHDALLVVFKGDRVDFFKFTASAPVRAFLARQQPAAKSSIAKK